MSVYKKLMEARILLLGTKLKKSGHNKFAGYEYFELGDFLPEVQKIFSQVGLCGVVSFGEELATLSIVDVESGDKIEITSPMKEAQLKGCHPIQNLGAVETYTRRYLWVTAMEIVEHDVLDATTGNAKTVSSDAQAVLDKNPYGDLDEESMAFLDGLADEINAMNPADEVAVIYGKVSTLLNEEKLYINQKLNSKVRSALKAYSQNLNKG